MGQDGLILGIDHFGASAPDTVIAEKLGFTGPAVAARVRDHLRPEVSRRADVVVIGAGIAGLSTPTGWP